jgi:two-component system, NarL family, response regulator DesR
MEDTEPFRGGLAALLGRENGIVVVAALDVDANSTARAARCWPQVVIFNTHYMVSQVLPLVAELRAASPGCAVVILCDPSKRGMLPPRRRAPGVSFLQRDTPVPLLAEAVRRVARGERLIDPRLEVAAMGTEKAVSTREWEVLGLAAQGESVADIARRLYLSLGTVRNHLSSVITKTGARNRLDAIRIARKDGWLR